MEPMSSGPIHVDVVRLDDGLPLPAYAREGDAGIDLLFLLNCIKNSLVCEFYTKVGGLCLENKLSANILTLLL